MTSHTIYLVTGANRGIGLGLTQSLLLRPDTTVIATVRSETTNTEDLASSRKALGSKLLIAQLSNDSETSAEELSKILQEKHNISYITTIIASAGIGSSFLPSLKTPLSSLLAHFQTNTLGPIALFQALYPLLSASPSPSNPKFVLISSSLGSIAEMEGQAPTLAYGISKAGANYFVRKVHFEFPEICALAVHPGWVKTENGQKFADSIGVKEPPLSLEESVNGVLEQVDSATKETTSGTFVSYDGTPIAW